MKNIHKILLSSTFGMLTLGLASCNNDEYLTVDHYSIIGGDEMFVNDASAEKGLIGCYDMLLPDKNAVGGLDGSNWGFKPHIMTNSHPTLDTQATGWDKDFMTEAWTADNGDLKIGWVYTYRAISRCNDYLAGLEAAENVSESAKTIMAAQAKALRAYSYMYLAQTWGRVPMLETGENYLNTPDKARAETDSQMWDFIIKDFTEAAAVLDWKPLNGEYGRVTKGMALSYLGEAYMWKAYKTGDDSFYANARDVLKQVIESGEYDLNPSFTTLWDPGAVWTKEAVWEINLLDQDKKTSWGPDVDAAIFYIYNCACPAVGGWGSLYLSWEWYRSFEKGDKRRDASAVMGPIPEEKGTTEYCYGYNPYLKQEIPTTSNAVKYKFLNGGEMAPSIWSLKWWRTARSNYQIIMAPMQIYFKRYTNVLFDYAECLFRINGENDATAWGIINRIRNRAFGNLEVGKAAELESTYLPYYKNLMMTYYGETMDKYPLPFNTKTVEVPDAKTYYTAYKAEKGFTSPVWLVALGIERSKEFNAEFSIKPDQQRSGFIEDYINHAYPKGVGYPATDPKAEYDWHTYREFDFIASKMVMPIPADELLKNKLMDQNEGY